jgi:hypothetical protein
MWAGAGNKKYRHGRHNLKGTLIPEIQENRGLVEVGA